MGLFVCLFVFLGWWWSSLEGAVRRTVWEEKLRGFDIKGKGEGRPPKDFS